MLHIDPEQELKELNKQLILINVIDAPAMVLIGLGMFAKLAEDPGTLHPLLGNTSVTTGMLVVGGLIAAGCFAKLVPVIRRRNELLQELST